MPSPTPQTLHFSHAARSLAEHLRAIKRPAVVGITGPQGSGKTTLANRLANAIGATDAIVLSTDRYLPDYSIIPDAEVDEPRHAALDELAAHLAQLRAGEVTHLPIWSFHSHKREGTEPIHPAPVVIVEGIFALHERVVPALDLAVYVEAPASVRWERVEARELTGERGFGVERSRIHFNDVADPTFSRHADSYRAAAHIVVQND